MTSSPFVLAQRAQRLRPSIILELMKVMGRPGLISLGGGLPSPDTFPIDALRDAADRVLTQSGRKALQYAATDGFAPLREWVVAHLGERGMPIDASQVLITNGSQQGLDLVGRLLLEPGTPVAVESPTYLGALQAFEPCEVPTLTLPCDDEGPLPSGLPAAGQARAMYLLPTFQNPSGRCMGLARRQAVVEHARSVRLPIIEDDPYADLWFDAPPPPPLASMWPEGCVYLGSFSKILAPGLRLGYIVSPPELGRRLVHAKQAADMHTSGFVQQVVHEVLGTGMLAAHLDGIRRRYRAQRDVMQLALQTQFAGLAHWVVPGGGMFFWLDLHADIDTTALLTRAVECGVTFLPGASFYADAPRRQTLRLSFVTETPERIREGVAILADLVRGV